MLRVNWRVCWYCALIWILAVAIGGFVILPWYFLALPTIVFLVTVLYFGNGSKIDSRAALKYPSYIFVQGLWIGFLWFVFMLAFDLLEITGFDSFNPYVFASDPRIFLKYPVVILVPVIYSLWLENFRSGKNYNKNKRISQRDFAVGLRQV